MGIGAIEYQEIVMEQGSETIKVYSEWASQFKWDWYCHFTFSNEIPAFKQGWNSAKWAVKEVKRIDTEYAVKMFRRWRRRICEEIWGKHFRDKGFGLSYILGIENIDENIHIHAVVGNNYGIDLNKLICRMCAKGMWELIGLRTGMCRIENFDYTRFKTHQSIFYLVKHQIKQQNIREFIVFPKGFILQRHGDENWLYDEKEKKYMKLSEYYKFVHNILEHREPCGLLPAGSRFVWQQDWVSKVWCAGICKQFEKRKLRGERATGDGETCFSGEQGEQNSLFPQNPEPKSPKSRID